VTPPGPAATPAPPTPFRGADTYRGPDNIYQVSIPSGWQREDHSSPGELFVLWSAPDRDAFAAIRLYNVGEEAGALDPLVEQYGGAYYSDGRFFTPIDRAPQDDGSVRLSYRVPQPAALYQRFGPGQVDLFYARLGPYFLVLEDLLPLLQNVLDSVYIDPDVAWGAVGAPVRDAL
jgi:hypothetical protein